MSSQNTDLGFPDEDEEHHHEGRHCLDVIPCNLHSVVHCHGIGLCVSPFLIL